MFAPAGTGLQSSMPGQQNPLSSYKLARLRGLP